MFHDNENPPTITTSELCARYHCTPVTLARWQKRRNYPPQFKTGKERVRNFRAVVEWEIENMPELHRKERTDIDDTIDMMRSGVKLGSGFVIRVEKVKRPKARARKKK